MVEAIAGSSSRLRTPDTRLRTPTTGLPCNRRHGHNSYKSSSSKMMNVTAVRWKWNCLTRALLFIPSTMVGPC